MQFGRIDSKKLSEPVRSVLVSEGKVAHLQRQGSQWTIRFSFEGKRRRITVGFDSTIKLSELAGYDTFPALN